MKKKSFEIVIEHAEKFMERRFQPHLVEDIKEAYDSEIKQARREGAFLAYVWAFAIIGLFSLFSSCNKCVTCTRTTTTTDLNDIPTSSAHESFPICDRNEKKYWNGRKTSESKGTYKLKTYTICSK